MGYFEYFKDSCRIGFCHKITGNTPQIILRQRSFINRRKGNLYRWKDSKAEVSKEATLEQ